MTKRIVLISTLVIAIPIIWLAIALVKDAGGTGLRLLNFLVSFNAPYTVERNIAYGKSSHQTLDVYLPNSKTNNEPIKTGQAKANESYPVLVFFYGGGWTWGKKAYFEFVADAFTRHGYIVVIPDYVLYPQGKYPDFIHDSASATAWVHENIEQYQGDPSKLVLSGHSAGAYNSLMVATNDKYLRAQQSSTAIIKAVAGIAGPYNFTPKAERYVNIFGRENFEDMKIEHHVSGNEPPMLLLHGSGDTTVAQANQSRMATALQNKQVNVNAHLYSKNMSHVRMLLNIHPWFASEEDVGGKVISFFDEKLGQN